MNEARKIAVVTGANRGIGFEISRQLAQKGYRVYMGGRRVDAIKAAAKELADDGFDVVGVELDVTDSDAGRAMAERLRADEAGRLHVLVNNAGILIDKGWQDNPGEPSAFAADVETLRETFEVNVYGAFRLCRDLLPLMRENKFGRVVNVSSGMGGLEGMNGGYPGYRLSKTALNAVTCIFADETKNDGDIKINSICPGWVQTDMGGQNAARTLSEGAAGAVWAATLPADGPSGGFFRDGERISW